MHDYGGRWRHVCIIETYIRIGQMCNGNFIGSKDGRSAENVKNRWKNVVIAVQGSCLFKPHQSIAFGPIAETFNSFSRLFNFLRGASFENLTEEVCVFTQRETEGTQSLNTSSITLYNQ